MGKPFVHCIYIYIYRERERERERERQRERETERERQRERDRERESNLLCRMKILKTMKNESLLCFCATRFTAVAALQA